MSEPRQPGFSRGWIFLLHVAIEQIRIQTVDFENDNSSCGRLSTVCKRTCQKDQSQGANHSVPPLEKPSGTLVEEAPSPAELIRMKASVCFIRASAVVQSVRRSSSFDRFFRCSTVASACNRTAGATIDGIKLLSSRTDDLIRSLS